MMVIPTLDQSGAEKQFSLVASQLPRDEFDVRVVALTRGGPLEEPLREAGIPVHILNKRWKFDPGAMWQLRSLIAEHQPDVLNTWLFAANAYGRMVGRFGGHSPRIIISERCVDSWKAGWQHWLDRRLLARTDRVIANSASVADFYAKRGVPEEQLSVITNGVAVPPLPNMSRLEFLVKNNLPSDAKLIFSIGRLAPQKRLQDLLWGMQILKQADPRFHLIICGDGPQRYSLPRYAQQVECDDVVRFLGHRDDASSLLHLADVFWLGSEFEGMSNSLMEAMACGKPVVVSDIPANRELVQHGEEGFVANLGDGPGFAQFTLKMENEDGLSQHMGDKGRQKMERDFSVHEMIDEYAEVFRTEALVLARN
ncbi:MAG: glycosyltransferase [Planctomycetaceae bacterium]